MKDRISILNNRIPHSSFLIPHFLIIFLFFVSCSFAFASGKKDEVETQELNNEWILCITGFDSSSLPESRKDIADVFMRSLVDVIKTVTYRIRISPEYAYYEDYAWSRSLTQAAKTLATKQNERTLLLYQGEPNWKYRQNLKKKDAEIVLAREAFEKSQAEKPLINHEPVFELSQANISGTFPAAPAEWEEYRFCQNQKADAFLTGTFQEFYGRYYVVLRLYVLYTRSYIYEGEIVFSSDDIEQAVNEIAGRLTAILAGSKPAAIAVNADPENTLVLINRSFAGRGNVQPVEIPQGIKTIDFSLEGYEPMSVEAELNAGELTEISVSLTPLSYGDVNINVPGKSGVSVYQGSMYVGEAPLTLRMPLNRLDYINVSTTMGEKAEAVYFTPLYPDQSYSLSLKTKFPPPSGQKRVNKARKWYYWAWGGTWIAGITAWISYGIFTSQNSALPNSSSQEFFDKTNNVYYFSIGAVVATGVAVAHEIFQIARYLYTATGNATPIVKTGIDK